MVFNRLFLATLTMALVSVSGTYGQEWTRRIDMSPSGGNTQQLHLLRFDSASNITSNQAAKAMGGMFTGLEAKGSYRITLSREFVDMASGDGLIVGATLATIGTFGLYALVGGPIARERYRLTVRIEIKDLNGRLVHNVTKSDVFTYSVRMTSFGSSRISNAKISWMSTRFSGLLSQARNAINSEAHAINSRLRPAQSSVEVAVGQLFPELSAHIPRNLPVAVLEITGVDQAGRALVLNALESRFGNAGFTVLNRSNLTPIFLERLNQARQGGVDPNTSFQIGHEIGARVGIKAEYWVENNQRQLRVRATDVQTLQVYGSASVTF